MKKANFTMQNFRDQLASYEAMPQFVVLGLLCGISCGLLIAAFRFAIDLPLGILLSEHVENFESLSPIQRFCFPAAGGLLLALLYQYWPLIKNKVGLVHLLERLAYHQGHIPFKNLLAQFISAVIALVSGQSVGREGPAIYMGASLSSLIGQWMHIPHNSQRILVACGSAAAISAAFNTPLAGVIFAMEVILLDYTIAGFTPIIVAAVSSSIITRIIFSAEPVFDAPAFDILSHSEIPWIIVLGIVTGTLAALFIRLMTETKIHVTLALPYKLILAGTLTGIVAIFYPQVMGTGYDTMSDVFAGSVATHLLLGLLIAKVLLTPIILGLGIPAGMIGPALFIGSLTGALLGHTGGYLADTSISHIGLYAMLGMGAMMAAILNAPLAALIALLELTYNPNIILPAMVAIVVANLTTRNLFNMPSSLLAMLHAQGLDYRLEPLAQVLSRASVAKVMEKNFLSSETLASQEHATNLLNQNKMWLVITHELQAINIFPLRNVKSFLERGILAADEAVDLTRIPAQRHEIVKVNLRSTLNDALQKMNSKDTDLLCVYDHSDQLIGILTRSQIENYYNNKQYH
jgi:CIC family chloride channel protein